MKMHTLMGIIAASIVLVISAWPLVSAPPEATNAAASGLRSLADAAKAAYESIATEREVDRHHLEDLYVWSQRWLQAELSVATNSEQRSKLYEDHKERMKDLHDLQTKLHKAGVAGVSHTAICTTKFYFAEAELLLQAQSKAPKKSR
jgi:hypothetical protein